MTLSRADVIAKKNVVLAGTENGMDMMNNGSIVFDVECSVQAGTPGAPAVDMLAAVEFFGFSISLVFIFKSADPLSGILKWLAWLTGDATVESFVNEMLNKTVDSIKLLPDANLRRMNITLDTSEDADKPTLSSFSITIEVTANFGRGDGQVPSAFLVTYSWSKITGDLGTLYGRLWNGEIYPKDFMISPSFDKKREVWELIRRSRL
jgi:hypothetical protein